jgi:hypothetical protein
VRVIAYHHIVPRFLGIEKREFLDRITGEDPANRQLFIRLREAVVNEIGKRGDEAWQIAMKRWDEGVRPTGEQQQAAWTRTENINNTQQCKELDELVPLVHGRTCGPNEAIDWAARYIDVPVDLIEAAEIPGMEALQLLRWANTNAFTKQRFWEGVFTKRIPRSDQNRKADSEMKQSVDVQDLIKVLTADAN